MQEPLAALRLTEVVKTYPGVTALAGVSLEVTPGEVHALVGENGAGKSTLIGVAAGTTVPDSGTVEIGGRPLLVPSPSLARSLGLAVVYQHHTVLEDLSVAENLLFAMPRERRPRSSRDARSTASSRPSQEPAMPQPCCWRCAAWWDRASTTSTWACERPRSWA